MTNFISVEELKAEPFIDLSGLSDTTISGLISRAQKRVENYLGYTLPYETVNEEVQGIIDSENQLILYPTKIPVRSLSSVSIVKGSFNADLTLTSGGENLYDIPEPKNRIILNTSQILLSTATLIDYQNLRNVMFFCNITYSAGYYMYNRPEDLIEALTLYVRDGLSRRYDAGGAETISQGAISITKSNKRGYSDFIKDAQEILKSYRNVNAI